MRGPSPEQADRFRAEIERLAGGPPGRLGIALSGGPDSLALLLLATTAFPGAGEAATVDHGLRAESAGEAEYVAGICERLGVPHAILRPARAISGSGQAAAREARYALLQAWAEAQRVDWLLTGHHADDQAETLLMRLNRGAGVGGLSSVRAINGRILRPLLGWRRVELEAIVISAGIEAVADPSNSDPRYDRARLREALRAAEWLNREGLARSARALAEAEDALAWAARRLAAERITANEGRIELDADGLPAELVRRLALIALRRVDPGLEPRGDALGGLLAKLTSGGVATLGGVKALGGPVWRFDKAPARRSASLAEVAQGEAQEAPGGGNERLG